MAYEVLAVVANREDAAGLQKTIGIGAAQSYRWADTWDVQFVFWREAAASLARKRIEEQKEIKLFGLSGVVESGLLVPLRPDPPLPFPVAELWEAYKGNVFEIGDEDGEYLGDMTLEDMRGGVANILCDPAPGDWERRRGAIMNWIERFRLPGGMHPGDAIEIDPGGDLVDGNLRLVAAVIVGLETIYVVSGGKGDPESVPEGPAASGEGGSGSAPPAPDGRCALEAVAKHIDRLDHRTVSRILGSEVGPKARVPAPDAQGLVDQACELKGSGPALGLSESRRGSPANPSRSNPPTGTIFAIFLPNRPGRAPHSQEFLDMRDLTAAELEFVRERLAEEEDRRAGSDPALKVFSPDAPPTIDEFLALCDDKGRFCAYVRFDPFGDENFEEGLEEGLVPKGIDATLGEIAAVACRVDSAGYLILKVGALADAVLAEIRRRRAEKVVFHSGRPAGPEEIGSLCDPAGRMEARVAIFSTDLVANPRESILDHIRGILGDDAHELDEIGLEIVEAPGAGSISLRVTADAARYLSGSRGGRA